MAKSKKLNIIIHPNPILRKKSKKIDIKKIDKKLKELIVNMHITLANLNGAGLAAPQIGKNIRLILVNTKDGYLTMINPSITWFSKEEEIGEEGCFSVVDKEGNIIFKNVMRPKEIKCEYYNEIGKKIKLNSKGLLARIIQHEVDHLDGILFIDRT